MMKVVRSSTLSNRKNCNSARSIPLAGSFTSFCANNRTEPATSPTNSPDEAQGIVPARRLLLNHDESSVLPAFRDRGFLPPYWEAGSARLNLRNGDDPLT